MLYLHNCRISMMFDYFTETKTITIIVTDMRKLLSIFMVMLMAHTTFAQSSQNYLLGDVNKDGRVTVADAMMVVNIIMNGYTPFSVSPTAVTMFADGSATIDIEGGYNEYEVTSSNSNVVKATLNGSTITLTAVAIGEAKVTVKDVQTFRTIEIPVKVETPSYLACPDDHHPHLIDLGLPSGTKWACCNVDTDHPENQSPTNYGGYYAWGEMQTKDTYYLDNYIHCDGSVRTYHNLGNDIAGTEYDVAHVKWGGSWVMPSNEQRDELVNNCTYEWTTVDGVKGGKFTSNKNGASIFLPAAGDRSGDDINDASSYGYYWSSTRLPAHIGYAYYLYFSSDDVNLGSIGHRYYGRSVRPVAR